MKILYVDDDEEILGDTKQILEDNLIDGEKIDVTIENDFDEALSKLENEDFDTVVIDVYRGSVSADNNDKAGVTVLNKIKKTRFVPVIFYTGLTNQIEHLASEFVKIVNKGDGHKKLKSEISNLIKSGLVGLRKKILAYTDSSIRHFFWEFVSENWAKLENRVDAEDLVLILVRRLSLLLSKENLPELFPGVTANSEEVKPLEFYVFPPVVTSRFETGDILQRDGEMYVIITPTCDLFPRSGGTVEADAVLMVRATPLEERIEFKNYMKNKSNTPKNELKKLIGNRKSTMFFLPDFPLMSPQVLDFQNMLTEPYVNLSLYEKIAKLDSPFAESMLANFLRQYDRVGIPTINEDKIIDHISEDR